MKLGSFGPMPWDMVVFFAITSVGFGYSVQRIMHPDRSTSSAKQAVASTQFILDLGCLDRRLNDPVTVEGGSIRLRGKFCNPTNRKNKEPGLRVKNVTTGHEGTVFLQGADVSFSTDQMVLTLGQNLIQIEWKEPGKGLPRSYTAEVYQR